MTWERRDVTVTGGCQCGAVRYRATAMLDNAHICHCRMCQKAVGGPFMAMVAAPDDALTFTHGKPATWRSSDEAVRGFCAHCGTPLFYRGTTGRTNLTIASLDDAATFPPKCQMGVESRLDWFATLPALDEAGDTGDDDPDWRDRIAASSSQHPDGESPGIATSQ